MAAEQPCAGWRAGAARGWRDTSVTGEPPAWRSEAALPVPASLHPLPSFLQATGQQPDQLHRRWSLPSPARPGDPVSGLGAGLGRRRVALRVLRRSWGPGAPHPSCPPQTRGVGSAEKSPPSPRPGLLLIKPQ